MKKIRTGFSSELKRGKFIDPSLAVLSSDSGNVVRIFVEMKFSIDDKRERFCFFVGNSTGFDAMVSKSLILGGTNSHVERTIGHVFGI